MTAAFPVLGVLEEPPDPGQVMAQSFLHDVGKNRWVGCTFRKGDSEGGRDLKGLQIPL